MEFSKENSTFFRILCNWRRFAQELGGRADVVEILDHAEPSETSVAQTEELIAASAIVSGFARLLAEKLTLLDDKTLENGGNIAIE